jgi:hypothetical protein
MIFVGGLITMYLVLSIISHRTVATGGTAAAFKKLFMTQQASNVIRTNEFRELVKTKEFRDVVVSLAEDQIEMVAQSLGTAEIR